MLRFLTIASCLIAFCQPLRAAQPTAQPAPLQLQSVINEALAKNFDIQVQQLEKQLGQLDIESQKALYDLITTVNADHTVDREEPPVPIFGTQNTTSNLGVGLQKTFSSGTRAELNWTAQRLSTNSQFSSQSVTIDSGLEAKLTQPLLQNFFGRNPRLQIDAVKLDDATLQLQIEDQIETVIANLINAFWNLALQQNRLVYENEAVRFAKDLLASNRKNQKLGLSESSDVLSAEANVSVREQSQLQTRLRYQQASLALARIANLPLRRDYTTTGPVGVKSPTVERTIAVNEAIQSRRDLKILTKQLKSNNILLKVSRYELWPTLDLGASLRLNGLAGSFGDSQREFVTEDNFTYGFSGLLTYNWDKSGKRAAKKRREIEQQQNLLRLKETETQVIYDIERALLEVDTQEQILNHTKRVITLQQKKLKEEQKRLRQGRSSTEQLVRNQDDLIEAQRNFAQATYNQQIASTALVRLQNILLETYSHVQGTT